MHNAVLCNALRWSNLQRPDELGLGVSSVRQRKIMPSYLSLGW